MGKIRKNWKLQTNFVSNLRGYLRIFEKARGKCQVTTVKMSFQNEGYGCREILNLITFKLSQITKVIFYYRGFTSTKKLRNLFTLDKHMN